MSSWWKLQDAKARFSELVDRALNEGPQHVTRRGHPVVVVLSEADYRKVKGDGKKKQGDLLALIRRCPAPEVFGFVEEGRRVADRGRAVEVG